MLQVFRFSTLYTCQKGFIELQESPQILHQKFTLSFFIARGLLFSILLIVGPEITAPENPADSFLIHKQYLYLEKESLFLAP